jgi:all-trans-retinol 13,14-reductase
MEKYDIIIIGSGLGGLISGAKLSKEGKKVLVIEQHYIPGGCATMFKRKGYNFEVGLHEMDGLNKKDPKLKIFKDLGISKNLNFIEIPEFYRFKNNDIDITIPNNKQKIIKLLSKQFPNEKKGIDKYFKKLAKIQKEINTLPMVKWKMALLMPVFPLVFPNIFSNVYTKLGDFLDSLIKDETLKLILTANINYYHDNPNTMSLLYFCVAQNSYYEGSGHFIEGGSQKLSDYLKGYIEKNNGKFLFNYMVEEIIGDDDEKVIGVRARKKIGENRVLEEFYGDKIISNSAIDNTSKMLDEKNRQKIEKKSKGLKKSLSLSNIYIAFKENSNLEDNPSYSTFFYGDITSTNDDFYGKREKIEDRSFVYVDYSKINSGLNSNGKEIGVICFKDYLEDWENLSEEGYKNKKKIVAEKFIDRLNEKLPGIKEKIEFYEFATPKTIKRYTLNPNGSIYGYSQIPKQAGPFRIMNKSPVKNLYFASAWSNPGGGFTGAILSGWFCANEILREKTYKK